MRGKLNAEVTQVRAIAKYGCAHTAGGRARPTARLRGHARAMRHWLLSGIGSRCSALALYLVRGPRSDPTTGGRAGFRVRAASCSSCFLLLVKLLVSCWDNTQALKLLPRARKLLQSCFSETMLLSILNLVVYRVYPGYLYTTNLFKRRVILKQQFTIKKGYYDTMYGTPYSEHDGMRVSIIARSSLIAQNY